MISNNVVRVALLGACIYLMNQHISRFKLHGVCMAMGATHMFYTLQNSASIEIRILTETMR